MTRPVEFNFWDKVQGKMFLWDDIRVRCNVFFGACSCIPLQYTGLLDVNGVKIFEGMVIRMSRFDNFIATVENSPVSACFTFTILAHRDIPEARPFVMHKADGNTSTILGNIYQQPELLK